METSQSNSKQRSACDECRKRKLKCPGELPRCTRCQREGIKCVYSARKQMGRPRKLRRDGESIHSASSPSLNNNNNSNTSDNHAFTSPQILDPNDNSNNSNNIDPSLQWDTASSNRSSFGVPNGYQGYAVPVLSIDQPLAPPVGRIDLNFSTITPTTSEPYYENGSVSTPQSQSSAQGGCACLSSMYLASSSLESAHDAGFPLALSPIQHAIRTAKSIVHCQECPRKAASARQNVLLVISVLQSIAMAFDKILKDIDEETRSAEEQNITKNMRMGDQSPMKSHMHTGGPYCPGGFNVELQPREWSVLAKKAVKKEIWHAEGGEDSLEGAIMQFEDRQKFMHAHDMPHIDEGDYTCLRLSNGVRDILSRLPE